ncbi:glycosyltransferase [uncultured Paraglaciecola sp.]|uniref:glycosyltransferase n=1 Tax=uncultured Paraglaciecola sp. TaxID=1765024 RepID=UPI0030DA557C|tara:strand:- start:8786 stop:9961 length:1176 start_codon:yes stop_codon:yes gene_type:complete
MQVDVIIEQRFYRCVLGQYWTENMFPNAFWQRYLQVFNRVNIVARVANVDIPETSWHRVDGERVGFIELPSYIGPAGFIKVLPKLIKVLHARKRITRCVIFRIPSILAAIYQCFAMRRGERFGAEVVGDPADVFAKGASKSSLRLLFRSLFSAILKRQCQQAISIAYVTEHRLQQRYPPNRTALSTHYSSIQLTDADYQQRNGYPTSDALHIVCVGNLAQPYKGCDFMLQGIAELKKIGLNISLTWVGGGALLPSMQMLAKKLAISAHVSFEGNVSSRKNIHQILDNADLFVLSSRQEGLPRVLIEAMARSLVCVATDVGGVDELLASGYIFDSDDINGLVQKVTMISNMTANERLTVSRRNYVVSENYHDLQLQVRRENMYRAVLKASQC